MALFIGLSYRIIFSKSLLGSLPCMEVNAFNLRNYYSVLTNSTLKHYKDYRWTLPSKFFPKKECFNKTYFSAIWNPIANINFKKFMRKILFIESTFYARRGYKWYTTLDGVNIEEFILLLEMPNTFASWFRIVELHVWMLLTRLMQDGSDFRKIRTSLINAMWEDAIKRAKMLTPLNAKLEHDFRNFYKEFTIILFSYDEAFLTDDKSLCNVLWYYFFDENCDDPQKLEALISYIRCQMSNLQLVCTKEIKEEKISKDIWKPLKPHIMQ